MRQKCRICFSAGSHEIRFPQGGSNGGMVDTKDLKSFGHCGCAGSSPASSTKKNRQLPIFYMVGDFCFFSKSPQKVLLPGSNVFTRLSLKFWIILIYGLHHIFDIERRIRIRFIFFGEKDVYIRCFQITQQRVNTAQIINRIIILPITHLSYYTQYMHI